jgi:hypothetical protein
MHRASSESERHIVQAGLLTSGSFDSQRLPDPWIEISGFHAAVVPGYSGGPAPDSHGVPSLALSHERLYGI